MPMYEKEYSKKYHKGEKLQMEKLDKYNHKVISIDIIYEKTEVFDIEVPETNNFVAE